MAIICKRFYALTLMKELGVTIGNSNYNNTDKQGSEIDIGRVKIK